MHMKTLALAGLAAAGGAVYLATRGPSQQVQSEPPGSRPKVVILGAGFAGLAAAGRLSEHGDGSCEIVLIDQHNYHLFTPILYQVAACGVVPYDAASPVRDFAAPHGVRFRQGRITGIDFDRQRVQLDDGEEQYDYLLIALGSTTNFFGNTAAQEHALPVKWLEDGVAIRNHVLDALEQASKSSDTEQRRSLLSFAIVGGGATGVETAGALAGLIRQLPRDYPGLDGVQPRIVVVEGESKLLGHMGDKAAEAALHALREMGVEVWLNTRAKDVEPNKLTTEDGRTIAARTILWTAGVRAPDIVAKLDARHAKAGSVAVDGYLQVFGKPNVYAAGDNAHVEGGAGKPPPLLAAAALQEGHAAAENILHALHGEPQQEFRYRALGEVVSLGRGRGVASFGPVVIDGLAGWLIWRFVHLVRITSFRNKLATALDWSMALGRGRDTARLDMTPTGAAREQAPAARG
jgi:NADH dehydrogenase